MRFQKTFLLVFSLLFLLSCDKDGDINFFSVEQDRQLGEQVKEEIADSGEYNILSRSAYPVAYGHIDRITNKILNSGEVQYRDEFDWEVFLIDDEVLNAFCVPGGKMYVYTGLIKYLETEDQLAGVMAHEIAHADHRHSTNALTRQYGFQVLLQVVLGNNPGVLSDIAVGLTNLQFSRSNETEADMSSVRYLGAEGTWNCAGAAGFFEKMQAQGNGSGVPPFLSTHPAPENRVQRIYERANEAGCDQSASGHSSLYQQFKNSLP